MARNSIEQTVYDYLNWELFGINPISSSFRKVQFPEIIYYYKVFINSENKCMVYKYETFDNISYKLSEVYLSPNVPNENNQYIERVVTFPDINEAVKEYICK